MQLAARPPLPEIPGQEEVEEENEGEWEEPQKLEDSEEGEGEGEGDTAVNLAKAKILPSNMM